MGRKLGRPRNQSAPRRGLSTALGLLALLAVALLTACGASDPEATEHTAQHRSALTTSFVKRVGVEFRVDNQPFHYAGTNNYYLWYAPLTDIGTDKNVEEIPVAPHKARTPSRCAPRMRTSRW